MAALRGVGGAAAMTATAPTTAASAQLTPAETAREQYVTRLKGSYTVGQGRTTDQAAQIFSSGYGGSNQSFHVNSLLRIQIPADKSKPATGVIGLIPWNTSTTGSNLFLDLTAVPGSEFHGLPTQFTWTVDPSSGGIYQSVGPYGTGSGTLTIRYFGGGAGRGAVFHTGQLQIGIQGLINTSGISNVLGVRGNVAKFP